jgi:hypothetical protein
VYALYNSVSVALKVQLRDVSPRAYLHSQDELTAHWLSEQVATYNGTKHLVRVLNSWWWKLLTVTSRMSNLAAKGLGQIHFW